MPEIDAALRGPRAAREALRALADRKPDLLAAERESWRMGRMDPSTTRDAAVLMLFGPSEAAAAGHGCAAVDEAEPEAGRADGLPEGTDVDVLIVVRAGTLRQHAGQPAFPGGRVDPEDRDAADPFVEAALREAVEETGLDRSGVEVLGTLNPVPVPVSNHVVTPVLAWWVRPSTVAVVDTAESAHVFRVPVRELARPENRHFAAVTHGRARHKSPAFAVESTRGPVTIWGFTGVLLDRILEETGWARDWDRTRILPAPL